MLSGSLVMSCLVIAVNCVYIPKSSKMMMPSISQSLINLGKMDFSFYINAPDSPKSSKRSSRSRNDDLAPTSGGCPCNSMKDFVKAPEFFPASDIFNRIISSNDLFHRSKEPMMSGLCCSEEETIVIEPQMPQSLRSMPLQSNLLPSSLPLSSGLPIPFPFNLESLGQPNQLKSMPDNTKTFELIFFADPKFKNPVPKKDIKFVGKDNFKLFNLSSYLPLSPIVKKDLNKNIPEKQKAVDVENTVKPAPTTTEKVLSEINTNHITNSTDNKAVDTSA